MNDSFDFLNLPGIKTTKVTETLDRIEVEAETITPIFEAQCCTIWDLAPDGARSNRRIINDTPHGGKPTAILMKVRRARCRHCKRRGMIETIPHVQPGRHMTVRLYDRMARDALSRPNLQLGAAVGVTEGTARSVLKEFIDTKMKDREIMVPRVLGIDEKFLLGDYRCILGNIEERTVVDLLPNRDHALRAWMEVLDGKEKVEVVAADMYAAYYRLQRQYFPHAAHVVDRFHVVRRANVALDKIRTSVANAAEPLDRKLLRGSKKLFSMRADDMEDSARDKLRQWSQRFPALGEAYWTKERYFEMYEVCHMPSEAEYYYKHWVKTLPVALRKTFLKYCSITPMWQPAVFSYFDHPFTTGYIESVNRVLDDIQRAGRGYSYEVIRGKILLSSKLKRMSFRERGVDYDIRLDEWDYWEPILMQDSGQSIDALESLFAELGDEPDYRWLAAHTTIEHLGSEIA